MSFRHLLLLFLFLLFLHALAFIFSVTRSFSLPESSFFHSGASPWHLGCAPRWSCGALPSLAALGSVARRSSASPGSAPMRVWFEVVLWEVLHSVTHAHHFSQCEMYRALQYSRSLALLLVGRAGWYLASVEETESSASSTSSGHHSAVLPIVGPPRGLLAWVS